MPLNFAATEITDFATVGGGAVPDIRSIPSIGTFKLTWVFQKFLNSVL